MDERRFMAIMRHLLTDVVSGKVQPGEPLPKEVDLAGRFDCSRGVAREALRGLELCRAINVRHGLGSTVRPLRDWDPLDPLVIDALISSPSGGAFASTYLSYVSQFVFFVALHDLSVGDTTAATKARRIVDAASVSERGTAVVLGELVHTWGGTTGDSLRGAAANALATAITLAGERRVLDRPVADCQLAVVRAATTAAAAGDRRALIELLSRTVAGR